MIAKLPLDRSAFSKLRTEHYLYIDKTEHAYNLINAGHRFFLSRPRRFGKSLFVSTLKEILGNNRALFKDLWIDKSDYRWHKYGIIHLDLSHASHDSKEALIQSLLHALHKIAKGYNIELSSEQTIPKLLLDDLVTELHKQFGKVAVLIDEYDHPILHTLHNPSTAQAILELLQSFFTSIKSLDEYIDFVFITGVSSFTRAGIFSGINNLRVITLNDTYASICGYTDEEIDLYFHEHIKLWAENESASYEEMRSKIKLWYNGYHFGKQVPAVYNPFSFMHAIDAKEFDNYWLRSGAPTFLIQELSKEYRKREFRLFNPETFILSSHDLDIHNIEALALPTLMFQTGYLTIENYNSKTGMYNLRYPNIEVKSSMDKYLLSVFIQLDPTTANRMAQELVVSFEQQNIAEAIDLLQQLFAHIPYQLHMEIEKFYHAILQGMCTTAGIKSQSEYSTSHGRIDLILDFAQTIYIIEIKFNKSAQEALKQIEERAYYKPFINQGKAIILLGLAFERSAKHFAIDYAMRTL